MMAKEKATPPYPDHECEGCNRGRELIVSTVKSSIVGGTAACHAPEGWVCMKYIPPETYAKFAKLREGRNER
jgi:hypothetical protein